MNQDEEGFLGRWARRKRETAEAAARPSPAAPPPVPDAPLPDPATLEFDSDFSVFLGAKVDAGLRYRALTKLFHSPQFNVMDGLDVYIDDYSRPDPISADLLKNLAHARDVLADRPAAATEPEPAAPAAAAAEAQAPEEASDER